MSSSSSKVKLAGIHEADLQALVIDLREMHKPSYPLLGLLAGSANGEVRPKRKNPKTGKWYSPSGQKLRRMGLIAGWPDLQLPVPGKGTYSGYCGLFIEMKLPGESLSPEQKALIPLLRSAGNYVVVCFDAITAWNLVVDWLELPSRLRL
jgi:hypothetical protein